MLSLAFWKSFLLTSHMLFSSIQLLSRVRLCDPMDCSMPGLPVHHQPPEFTQTHVHYVSGAIHISSSVVAFSSCLQSFPASGSFPMSHFFVSGGQNIGVSASTSVLPMNIQEWFPLGLRFDLLVVQHHSSKASILRHSAFFTVQLSHPYMTTGKP